MIAVKFHLHNLCTNGSDIVRIGLAEQGDEVDDHTDPAKTAREKIHDSHAGLPLIEFMGAKDSNEEAEEKGGPLVPRAHGGCNVHALVLLVLVAVVDDDLRSGLRALVDLFDLTTAMRANDGFFGDLLSAFLAEFGFLSFGYGGGFVFIHDCFLQSFCYDARIFYVPFRQNDTYVYTL